MTCMKCKSAQPNFNSALPKVNDIGYQIIKTDTGALKTVSELLVNYEINENLEPGWYCHNCFQFVNKNEICEIQCKKCSKKYPSSLSIKTDCGIGCSSFVTHNGIACGYGSNYDYNEYKWINDQPEYLDKGDTICDKCIQQFISNNLIALISEL